ncbi:MAG: peroxiredoxin [Sulfuritalea sp.]|nr:peroxiredoxin [Sulfuritalea sp.]
MIRKLAAALPILFALVFLAAPARAAVPAPGTAAPGFSLPDQSGAPRRLAEWRGKWVVLYFYPKDDTPGCTTEACSFRDDISLLTALGAQVVGISVDDTLSHKAFAEKYQLPFPLLSDATAEVARQYGALSDWVVVKMAKRYTFLIDPAGRVAKVYLTVDAARHSKEVAADLKALQARASAR